jgi:hypothetical protein
MKFILQENIKFLLDERFKLTENAVDDAPPEVKNTLKWLQLLLNNVGKNSLGFKKIDAYRIASSKDGAISASSVDIPGYSTKVKEIETTSKALAAAIESPVFQLSSGDTPAQKTELVEVYTALTAYIESLKNAIDLSDNDYKKQLQKAINTLEDLKKQLPENSAAVNSKKFSDKALPKLIKQLQQLPTLLKQVTTLINTATKNTEPEIQAATQNKLKEFCTFCQEKANFFANIPQFKEFKIKTDTGRLFSARNSAKNKNEFTTEEKDAIATKLKKFPESALKNCQSKISEALKSAQELEEFNPVNKDKIIANIDTYRQKIELVVNNFKQVLESAVYADLEGINKAENNKKVENIDWKSKLAATQNKIAVVEEFIYAKWPTSAGSNKAAAVVKIKETFLIECETYGFDEASNPFINFINKVYLPYQLKPELYNVIHNMVATHILTGADLQEKGLMKALNIIFCADLYTKSAGEIKLYLRKQAKLLQVTWTAVAEGRKRFKTTEAMAYYALYTHTTIPKIREDDDAENRADIPEGELPAILKLRPMNEVEDYENQWVGTVSDTSGDSKPKAASNDVILNQIKDTNEAVKVITTLVLKFSSDKKIAAKANTCVEVRTLLASSTTPTALAKLVASVESKFNIIEITASNALKLIESILASDKFNLTKAD